ncbi:anti-sigma factor domain-containing protein [Tepidibacter hydrothermalis]|uniref:Anti-sigma factor domain-containing protein n=1 Tax=Tepidibacter hydrothermalis TaxID=3036126 RepID=A0ABY8EC57_9FIRM|nr:anti-sigma factor domain-containing protein [Tepidibacter hydrothermalis]WFD09169.1 anti-sigma factor domain-containing protein [Tepidibacter hydrothermalis]
MRRGMVLKLNNDYALIATDDSDLIRIKRREGMRIGQKIFVLDEDIIFLEEENEKRSIKSNYLKVVATLAACIAIVVLINNIFLKDNRPLYAMVSLDINPSFELGIDDAYNVIQIKAMNDESKNILDTELIGEPLTVVVSEILSDVEKSGYALESDNTVLVSTVSFKNDDDKPLQKVVADGVSLAMSENEVYKSVKVIFIESDEQDLKAAEEQRLSVGKYRLLEMGDHKIDKTTIEKGRVSDLIKKKEIKDDLKMDKTIQIIDGKDLQKLEQIEENIEDIKNRVDQLKDVLNREDFEKIEDLFDDIDIMENQLINEDSEFEELYEVIESLQSIIKLKEDKEVWKEKEPTYFYKKYEEWEEELDDTYEEDEEWEEELDDTYEEDEEWEEELDDTYEEDEEWEEELGDSYEEDEEREEEELDDSYEEDEEWEEEELDDSYEEDGEWEDEKLDDSYEEDGEWEDEKLDDSYEEEVNNDL